MEPPNQNEILQRSGGVDFSHGLGPEKQELLRLIGSVAEYRVTPAGSAT